MALKLTIELNVFGALMKDRVLGNVYSSLIITLYSNGCDVDNGKFM